MVSQKLAFFVLLVVTNLLTGLFVYFIADERREIITEVRGEIGQQFVLNKQVPNHYKGDISAPVTIIGFTDFDCYYCEKFALETLPRLLVKYDKTIRYIEKNYPISGHTRSLIRAEAVECAGEQGKYWFFFPNLFSATDNEVADLVSQLPDTFKYRQCMENHVFRSIIDQTITEGRTLGIRTTPTFLINQKMVIGFRTFEQFSLLIEDACLSVQKSDCKSYTRRAP